MSASFFSGLSDTDARWNKPTDSSGAVWDDRCQCFRSRDYGWSTFISHKQLNRRSFLKNNDLIVTADFNGENHNCQSSYSVYSEINTLCTIMIAFLLHCSNFEN